MKGSRIQSDVPLAEPADDPPLGEMVDIAECPLRHAVTEVITPSSQLRVQPAQQVGERSMKSAARKSTHLRHH